MLVKLIFGNGHIITDRIESLDCPNSSNGIGDIVIISDCPFWTGDTHIYSERFRTHFGHLTEIVVHPDFNDNSDYPEFTIWEYKAPFTYSQFAQAAKLLQPLMDPQNE